MYESAVDARVDGRSAGEFEERMLADEDMLDVYDGDRATFERELEAVLQLVWFNKRRSK